MKKFLIVSMIAVFAMTSAVVYAAPGCREKTDKKCGMAMDQKSCGMCSIDATVKVTDTKDGVVITISAKEGGADVKAIQEAAKNCCCMNKEKAKGKVK